MDGADQRADLRRTPKYEKAALRWLERYLTEGTPRLGHFREFTADLAKRDTLVSKR
jgi:hypothetical protein